MCGLIAIISKENKTLTNLFETAFKQMLYVNALRGFDSTGICKIDYSNNPHITKDAIPAGSFLFKNKDNAFLFTGKALFGHNRAATRGSITTEFAHPHKVDNIVLMHNGTLWTHRHLADVASDSLAITTAFSKEDPKIVIPKLNGAFALIWYDSKNKSYHWVRNKERPLFLIETASSYVLVSELDMGLWILNRNDAKIISTKEILPYEYYSFKHEGTIEVVQLKKTKEYPEKTGKENTIINGFNVKSKEEIDLAEELKKNNITKDSIVSVEYYWVEPTAHNNVWKRYVGLIVNTSIEVSTYSNTNLIDEQEITGKASNIITYTDDAFPTVIVTLFNNDKKKRTALTVVKTTENTKQEETIPLKTLNGISFTPEIKKQVEKHGACYACNDSISQNDIPKSLLIIREQEVTKPKFDKASGIYYGTEQSHKLTYKLYCPKCVSFFSKCDKNWIQRETSIAA